MSRVLPCVLEKGAWRVFRCDAMEVRAYEEPVTPELVARAERELKLRLAAVAEAQQTPLPLRLAETPDESTGASPLPTFVPGLGIQEGLVEADSGR